MALTHINSYAVSHDKSGGGGGGTTIIKQYGGGTSDKDTINVGNINGQNIVTRTLETNSLSAHDASILYLVTKEGKITKLNGDSLEYNTGYIGTLASDDISAKKITADDISAVKAWIETLNSKEITTEYLTVTKQAHFFELIIDKIRSVGGQLIITPASCIIDYVWGINNSGQFVEVNQANESSIKQYAIFWRSTDADGRSVSNDFVAGDQVICQSFNNNVKVGTNYNISNKYYWNLVDRIEQPTWINLSTGAMAPDAQAATGNKYWICMGYSKTYVNGNLVNNNIAWDIHEQSNDEFDTNVTWGNMPAVPPDNTYASGMMTSASKVYGIKITPRDENVSVTNSISFNIRKIVTDINDSTRNNYISNGNNIVIGVYFKDDTFKIYSYSGNDYTNSINLTWYNRYDPNIPIDVDESQCVDAPIKSITIISQDEVNWALCNAMIISNTDKDASISEYSSIPSVGDNLVQLGYRYDDKVSRQNAIIISAYKSIDQGGTYDGKTWEPVVAPSYAQYIGINDYNLFRRRQSYMDGNGARFVGDITLCSINGQNVGDKMDEQIALLNKMNTKLRLSTNLVELYEDNQGNVYTNTATFNVDILRTDETGTSILNAVPEGYKIRIITRYDNTTSSTTINAGASTTAISTLEGLPTITNLDNFEQHVIQKEIRLIMLQNGIEESRLPVIASETIAYRRGLVAVKDGGKYEFRYQNTHNTPAKPATGSDGLSGGWSKNPGSPDIENEIWTWMTYAYCNAGGQYGTWSDPIRITGENGEDGADGASVEYIYTRNNTGTVPTAPPQTQTDDWHGLDPTTGITWTDNPKGVAQDMQYEFISCRTKRAGGIWGLYSTPALWSKWGEKGQDGDGYEYIFKLQDSLTPPADPTPDDWETNPYYQTAEYWPTGWTDDPVSVTQNNKYLFVAVRTRKEGVWNRFSKPALWARYAEQGETGGHYEFRYKNSTTQPNAPTGQGTSDGWSNTPTNPDVNNKIYTWMSQCYVTPATPEDHYGEWSTPVRITGGTGEDGADGTDIEFVYTRTNTTAQVPTPATNQIPDWHGESGGHTWTDNPQGVASDMRYEWMSMRYLRQDVYTAYTTPVIWSAYGDKGMDGDGFEYVFMNTVTANVPSNPTPDDWETNTTYQKADYIPSGWTDDPESVSESVPYEWVMIRKRIEGKWQRFSDPALWARWAVQDASGGHYEFRFNKSITMPSKPTGTGLTGGWSRNAANLTQQDLADGYLNWMSQCYVNGNDEYGTWSDVFRITGDKGKDGEDGQSIEFIYKGTTENTAPTKPDNRQQADYVPSGWTDNPSGIASNMPYEWVCSREIENGTWSDWNGPVLWSAWGRNGTDGDGVEYIFKRTSNSTAPSNPAPSDWSTNASYQADDYIPSGWEDNPPSLDANNPYMWVCIRKGHTGSWEKFSDPALWSHYAKADEAVPGENAKFDYLVPIKEELTAMILAKITGDSDKANLKCDLEYKICKVDGGSAELSDDFSGYTLKMETYNMQGTQIYESSITNGKFSHNNLLELINSSGVEDKRDYMSCYTEYNSSCPTYIKVILSRGNVTIDTRIKYVELENGAVWKLRDDAIVSAVATSRTERDTALSSYSTRQETGEMINSQVNTKLENYSTTIAMRAEIREEADKITHTVENNYYTKDDVNKMLNNQNSYHVVLDLLNGGYSDNNYYPIAVPLGNVNAVENGLILTMQVDRSLDEEGFQSGNHPEWGSIFPGYTSTRGVALICNWSLIPSHWGEFDAGDIYVNNYSLKWTRKGSNTNDGDNVSGVKVIGNLEQHAPSTTCVFYLRGGSKYNFRATWPDIVEHVQVNKYTYSTGGGDSKTYYVIYGADSSSIKVPEKDKMSRSDIIQTAKQISLSIYSEGDGVTPEDLRRTGIDVTDSKIVLQANKVTFTDSTGKITDKISIDPNTGTLKATNANLTGELVIQQGSKDGLKLDSSGNILRYNTHTGWVQLYGARCVRYINSTTYLDAADDYVIAGNGTYNVYLPNHPYDGKIITVKNLNDGILIYTQGSDRIVLNNEYSAVTWKDLDNYDRAELVYYKYRWYWNYMET